MKRQISNQNSKKKTELRKLVLAQLSKMRKKMKREHPGMLEGLREKIEASNAQNAAKRTSIEKNELPIDQSKNIEAIEKMLEIKSKNPNFEKAVKAILSKDQR